MEKKTQRSAGCKRASTMLFEYADKTLKPEDAAWLEQHIEDCPECTAELERCRKTLELIHYSKYEPRYSISDAVMRRISTGETGALEAESAHNPLISAFTGFIKNRRYFPVGTVAAALIILTVTIFNHDVLFSSQKDIALSASDNSVAEDKYHNEEAREAVKSTAPFYASPASGASEICDSNDTEAERVSLVELEPPVSYGLTFSTDDNEIDAAVPETNEVLLPNDMNLITGKEETDTSESTQIYEAENLYAPLTIAYISSADVMTTINALGLEPFDSIEFSDGSTGYVCVYNMETQSELIDYLMLNNVDFEVNFTNNSIPEDQTAYLIISSIK